MGDVIDKLEQEIREENYKINNENYSKTTRMLAESYLSGILNTIKLMGYEVQNEKIVQKYNYEYEEELDLMR